MAHLSNWPILLGMVALLLRSPRPGSRPGGNSVSRLADLSIIFSDSGPLHLPRRIAKANKISVGYQKFSKSGELKIWQRFC